MSLWLDLIPRIHRSDNLSEQHHQLDNFDDLRTFASEGLDVAEYNRIVRLYSQRFLTRETQTPRHPSSLRPFSSIDDRLLPYTLEPLMSDNSSFAKRDNQLLLLENTNSKRSTVAHRSNFTSEIPRPRVLLSSPNNSVKIDENPNKRRNSEQNILREDGAALANSETHESKEDQGSFSMTTFKGIAQVPLGITVGVGCVLLLLNVIVFAAVFYQKSKARRCLEKRQRETSCCRHGDAAGSVKCESSPDRLGKEARTCSHRRGCSDETSFYQSQKFQCSSQKARFGNRQCEQADKFSEFERLSYTSSAENGAFPGNRDDDQQPLASVPCKDSREVPGYLKSSSVVGADNCSGSISSTSGSVGSKHYPLPPPPPISQRPGCHHPLQMHQNHHISGVFEKPQQQLLTKDVSKMQHHFKGQSHNAHETSRRVTSLINSSTTTTSVATGATSKASSASSAANAAVVETRAERPDTTNSIKTPSWKSTNADDSCYEEALFNELSKLEVEPYDNDTSTLV